MTRTMPTEMQKNSGSFWQTIRLERFVMDAMLLVICAGLALSAPNFLTVDNLLNILRSISMLGLIAFGMTMIIVAKEIDISVGSSVALAACLIAWLTDKGVPIPLGIPITLATGFFIGLFTGFLRVKYEVPSFISTLALFTALRGMALMITKGFPITPFPEWYYFLGGGYVLGIPFPAIVLLVAFAATHFVMAHTTFGAAVYAVGGNDEAARLSGINVALVRYLIFAVTGALAALSGIMLSSRIMSGTPTVAQQWELDAITAVIVGGANFSGGVGTVRGTLVGLVFIGVIVNGMTLLNVQPYYQYLVRGGLILAAVLVNRVKEKD